MSEWQTKRKLLTEKVVNAMCHPYVRKFSRFARFGLETMSLIESKSKASIAVGALSLLDSVVEAFEMPVPSKIEQWAKSRGLSEHFGYLTVIIMSCGLLEKSECAIVCSEDTTVLREMRFDFGSIYYMESQSSGAFYENELDKIHGYFYTTKDFQYDKLFDAVWNKFNSGIYLSVQVGEEEFCSARNLRVNSLNNKDLFYVSQTPDLNEFIEELRHFRAVGISRSYMLAGIPGTGKSSFSILAAKAISGRIVKVDPSVTRHMGSAELEFVIRNLAPDVILFDDFDKAMEGSEQLLFTIENIKQQFPRVAVLATVNDFDGMDPAIKRPGRFDQTIWFMPPDAKDRQAIVNHYIAQYNLTLDKKQTNALVKKTNGLSPAYIRELCTRISRKGFGCLEATLVEFSRTLDGPGESKSAEG